MLYDTCNVQADERFIQLLQFGQRVYFSNLCHGSITGIPYVQWPESTTPVVIKELS